MLYFKYMRPHEARSRRNRRRALLFLLSLKLQKSANFKNALKTILKAATLALNAVEMKVRAAFARRVGAAHNLLGARSWSL